MDKQQKKRVVEDLLAFIDRVTSGDYHAKQKEQQLAEIAVLPAVVESLWKQGIA